MLKTFSLRGRELPITVYGPPGLEDLFTALRRIFGRLTFRVELQELRPGEVLDRGDHHLLTFAVDHGVAAVGYSLVELPRPGRFDVETADALGVPPGPERGALQRGERVALADGRVVSPADVLGPPRGGRKIVLAADTAPSRGVVEAARGADVLVHEATFCADEAERARETRHSTAAEAAAVAAAADVRLLALTHLSSRYVGSDVVREAEGIFPAVVAPRDFDVIDVPFPERGEPVLVKRGARERRDAERAPGEPATAP